MFQAGVPGGIPSNYTEFCDATVGPITGPVGKLTTGVSYTIASLGTTNFTLIGATANTVGLTFTATGPGAGTGTVTYAGPLADPTGATDSAPAINAALALCPAGEFVYLPATSTGAAFYPPSSNGGFYLINSTLHFPTRGVVLRGAGSQIDPAVTAIQCTTATAVSMQGSTSSFKGYLNVTGLSGYTVGSTTLTFGNSSYVSGVSVGDTLVVLENPDPSLGVTVNGNLEAIQLPSASFTWAASKAVPGAYYLTTAAGGPLSFAVTNVASGENVTIVSLGTTNWTTLGDPASTPAVGDTFTTKVSGSGMGTGTVVSIPRLQTDCAQVCYSLTAGSEAALLQISSAAALQPGDFALDNADGLGWPTIYVMLPGMANAGALAAPNTDGIPNGGVWLNPGIAYGGANNGPGGTYEHHGQGFKVLAKSGATITLDRPFYWTFTGNGLGIRDYTLNSGMGLENLNIQIMQGTPANDAVIINTVENSWVRNVEVRNSAQNFIVASNTIDCEYDHNYVTNPWNAQGGSGYGIRLLGWNFNDLVEDNIAYFCRHSFVEDGIDTGNVLAYNFSQDPNDIANYNSAKPYNPTTNYLVTPGPNPPNNDGYLYQDFLMHGSNPRFDLYEGNVGGRGYCDFAHGSSNNMVFFRNHFRMQENAILQYQFLKGSEAIDFDRWNDYNTVVGNILGYPTIQTDQAGNLMYEGNVQAIYRLGYNADDSAKVVSDTTPKATLYRAWNYDYFNVQIFDGQPGTLPSSLFLTSAPPWFGNLKWPPVDPTNPALAENEVPTGAPNNAKPAITPAMYRFLNATPPPTPPYFTAQPSPVTTDSGLNVTFSAAATGYPAPTFQWQVSTNGGTTWANLPNGVTNDGGNYSNVTTPAMTITATAAALNGYLYQCVATNSNGSTASSAALLSVNPVPLVTSALSATGTEGTAITTYTITATNPPLLSYSATGLPAGLTFNTASGVISGIPTQSGVFAVQVTATNANGIGPVTTVTFTINPNALPAVSVSGSVSGSVGNPLTPYQVAASNPPITLYAATGLAPGLSIDPVGGVISGVPTQAGDFTAQLTVKNIVGASPPVPLVFNIAPHDPTITIQPAAPASVNVGSEVVLSVVASGLSALNYQWSFNGAPIPNALASTLTLSNIQTSAAGAYQVVVTDAAGLATSTTVNLAVNPSSGTAFASQPVSQTIAPGSTVTFSVTPAGSVQSSIRGNAPLLLPDVQGTTTYQWQFNGVNLTDGGAILGSSTALLYIQGASAAYNGTYDCIVTTGGVAATSNTAGLTVATVTNPGYVVNISSRAFVGTGDSILIGGFFVGGSTSRSVLIQALGPALVSQGVSGTLPNPVLSIHDSTGKQIYLNSGWGANPVLLKAAAAAYANPVLKPDSADSEALLTLPPGGYTAEIYDAHNATGVALCAIYELP